MKKLFAITLLLFSASTFAQKRFIDVEVGDTITLRLTSLEVELTVRTRGRNNDISQNVKKVEQALRRKNYKYQTADAVTFYPPSSSVPVATSTIMVNLSGEAEWDKLNKLLEQFDFVRTGVQSFKVKDEDAADTNLYIKLLEQAKAKAGIIASGSDSKLGNIISAREPKDLGGLEFNIHDTYYVTGESRTFRISEKKLVGSLFKKLVVRFAVE